MCHFSCFLLLAVCYANIFLMGGCAYCSMVMDDIKISSWEREVQKLAISKSVRCAKSRWLHCLAMIPMAKFQNGCLTLWHLVTSARCSVAPTLWFGFCSRLGNFWYREDKKILCLMTGINISLFPSFFFQPCYRTEFEWQYFWQLDLISALGGN